MRALALAVVVALGGCATSKSSAPVIERAAAAKKVPAKVKAKESDWRPQTYTVQKGDTLYGIELEHGFDYKDVAEWNGIEAPYTIRVGQTLQMASAGQPSVVTTPLKAVPDVDSKAADDPLLKTQPKALKQPYSEQLEKTPPARTEPVPAKVAEEAPAEKKEPPAQGDDDDKIEWGWPAAGKLIAGFNEASVAGKGLDIGGKSGQPVLAAAPGKVVYSGSGLRGYGKLVIIKHNKTFLSAYAHNHQILVKEGQTVAKGQKIAEMGDSDSDQVKLHFEIRRLGKPVDPMKYLPNEKTS